MTIVQKYNKRLKISLGIFTLLTIFTLGSGWLFALKTNKDVSRIQTETKFLNQEALMKTEVSQRYNRVAEFQPIVFDSLPTSKEISSFLADVENVANKNGIKITMSTIGNTASAKNKQTNLELSQTISQNGYYELPIKYTVEGSYVSFLSMLNDLSNLRRLNTISDMNIIKNTSQTGSDYVQVNFVDSVYIAK